MKTKYVSLIAASALAVGGIFCHTSTVQAAPETPITDFHFDINTKGDDKDKGESLNFQIIKNDTEVVFDSGWIHGDLKFHNNSNNTWAGAPKVPVTLADAPNLKLRVEKQGEKGWKVSFRVLANNKSLVLLSDTPEVLFGKRNPVVVHNPLDGPGGVKFQHWDGGTYHIYGFTAKP